MICGSRCLPHVPPRVLPKFVDPVTPRSENSAGLEAVPGPAGPERGLVPCGHCVFNFKNVVFEKGSVLVPSA